MKTLRKTYIKPRSTAYDIPTEEELLAGNSKPRLNRKLRQNQQVIELFSTLEVDEDDYEESGDVTFD